MKLTIPKGYKRVREGRQPGKGAYILRESGWVPLRKKDDFTTEVMNGEIIIAPVQRKP